MKRVDEDAVDGAEEAEADDDEDDEAEPAVLTTDPPEKTEEVESLDELIARRPTEDAKPVEEEEDDSMLALDRDERVEPLSVKVVPQQPTEFVCKKCFLVKHRSQLADKRRQFCRDCA